MAENHKVLVEKLKYLIELESDNDFKIIFLDIDYYDGKSGYALDIKFEYDGIIHGEMPYFTEDINSMMDKLFVILSKVTITPDKKISYTQNLMVNEGYVRTVDFSEDETHTFLVSIFVHYPDND